MSKHTCQGRGSVGCGGCNEELAKLLLGEPTGKTIDVEECKEKCRKTWDAGAAAERARIVAWLRSDPENVDPIGGDNYVARTLAEDIEEGEHWRWDSEASKQ